MATDAPTGGDDRPQTSPTIAGTRRSGAAPTLIVCAGFIVLFVALALWGARHRSATYDEPMHAVAAYVLTRHGDFRANAEDPNLWQRWATIAQPRDALRLNFDDPRWRGVFDDESLRWAWCVDTLYRTPGTDADAFLWRMRCTLVVLAAAAAGLVAWWGWQIGGGVAAVVAVALFCLDPNLLAHSTQVKNDVALTLVSLALALAVWRAGRRLTWWGACGVVAAIAAGLATKFSGVALVGVAAILLTTRALSPRPWPVLGRELDTRRRRLTAAAALVLTGGGCAVALLWACYAFRFNPAPPPDGRTFDAGETIQQIARRQIISRHPDVPPSGAELDAWRAGPALKVAIWAEEKRLLPQAWLHGLMQTYANATYRSSFLRGRESKVGFAAYFPLAFLFKTPVGTTVAVAAGLATAAIVLLSAARARRAPRSLTADDQLTSVAGQPAPAAAFDAWTAACLLLPVALYLFSAMRANLNIGLRHILPIYPPLFVLAGWAASVAYARWGRRIAWVPAVVVATVAVETVGAAPNFLAFFNAPAGGARGGIRLLGDSNLDWGQDLPALADWQERNPSRRLSLLYFGTVPPSYYGLRYVALPGSTAAARDGAITPADAPDEPGVIAISATHLQGIYLGAAGRGAVEPFRHRQPTQVLNGTIYLFDLAAGAK